MLKTFSVSKHKSMNEILGFLPDEESLIGKNQERLKCVGYCFSYSWNENLDNARGSA